MTNGLNSVGAGKEGDRCGCGFLGGNGGTGGTFFDMWDTSEPLLDGAGELILDGASKYWVRSCRFGDPDEIAHRREL